MYERKNLYYTSDGGGGDYRSYRKPKSHFNHYDTKCDHCGGDAKYHRNDVICEDLDCTSNRHRNNDGSRNHKEARKVDRTKYHLIG